MAGSFSAEVELTAKRGAGKQIQRRVLYDRCSLRFGSEFNEELVEERGVAEELILRV